MRVYINNGSTLAENSTWQGNLTAVGLSSLSLGDVDNDRDLDLALSGDTGGGNGLVKIYINNGTTLTENSTWQGNLTGINVYGGTIVFGDINNDGKLDLALVGSNSTTENGIYINNGTTFTKNSTWLESLPYMGHNLGFGSLSLGDIDNDGDLDMIVEGGRSTSLYQYIYINNGTSLVENSTWISNFMAAWNWVSLTMGDFNNDGKTDLAAIGTRSGDHLYIYNNNGSTLKVNQTEDGPLGGYFDGSIHFGDYDNDGDLDLAAIGKESGRARVYENNQSNNYIFGVDNPASANISTSIIQGSVAWSDVDSDGNLDLSITGDRGDVYITKIYINNNTAANTPPNASTSFSSSFANGLLTLTWGNGSDVETPALGLYYNLRVGTSSGGNQIVSGVFGGSSNPTAGYFGNMMQRKSISLSGLSASTTYYWSVQTIDTGLAKGNWSAEQTYTTASNIVDPVITLNSPINLYNTTNASITFNVNVTDDSGLANVTLWGNWSGWHANETNSSNLTNGTYYFSKSLSSYGDGVYAWKIRACDGYSNCINSSTRTFMIDTTNPGVTLITPTNAETWTSSSTVTFVYNVSDLAIANCSLIIDNAVVDTDNSITVNTNQEFSRSLSNTAYTWSINCTDFTGHTANSTTRTLTVTYTAPVSTGGGGGGALTATTYNLGELTAEGIIKKVSANDNIKFEVAGINKTATVTAVGSNNVSIKIGFVNFTLSVNETKKLDMNGDNVYDLAINVDSITAGAASLTFKQINETVPIEAPAKEEIAPKNISTEKETGKGVGEEKRGWIYIIVTLLIITSVIGYLFLRRRKNGCNKNR